MTMLLSVWAGTALAIVVVTVLVKALRLRHRPKAREIHWAGLIIIAVIAGAIPAFWFDYTSPRSVVLPEDVAPRPSPARAGNR